MLLCLRKGNRWCCNGQSHVRCKYTSPGGAVRLREEAQSSLRAVLCFGIQRASLPGPEPAPSAAGAAAPSVYRASSRYNGVRNCPPGLESSAWANYLHLIWPLN